MSDKYNAIARGLMMRTDVGDLDAVELLAAALRQAAADAIDEALDIANESSVASARKYFANGRQWK